MRPTSTPKIEHEDNFFIELDFRWQKILFNYGNRSHDQHVGPAPYGGGLQISPVLLDKVTKPTESGNRRIVVHLFLFSSALIPILDLIEGDQDSAALTPLLKYLTGFYP